LLNGYENCFKGRLILLENCLDDQFKHLRNEAKKRGLVIRKDERLEKTPYRAAHPFVEFRTGLKHTGRIDYDPKHVNSKRELVMDVRHEIIEYDKMGKLKRKGYSDERAFKVAHNLANKKQRNPNAI